MNMGDYIRDKLFYILVYYLGLGIFSLVSFLDLYNRELLVSTSNLIYGFFLASLILVLFLIVDYRRKKEFLNIISQGGKGEDLKYIFDLPDGVSREYDLFKSAYEGNYSKYIGALEEYIDRQDMQKKFNNRWIHEMKTPLSVMKLVLDESRDGGGLDLKAITSMDEELERLSNGLEMGLYALRVDEFQSDFKAEEVEILALLRQAINENKRSFILNSVYPRILFEKEYMVQSDRKWLKFVINQILVNAIKYSSIKGEEGAEIIIDIRDASDLILIIEDKGIGIPKSDINRIFDPFFTGINGRKYLESTGMGLFLVGEILDKLGHQIKVESREGEGSRFSIVFHEEKNIYKF